MLGVVDADGRGEGDRLLFAAARVLRGRGLRVAGAVQENTERPDQRQCDMDLHVLTGSEVLRISQRLGSGSRGCRIDSDALERAAGMVAAALAEGADLLIVNKFGKQEAEGHGFRPLIAEALTAGIPVLTTVKGGNRAAFDLFAGGLATPVAPELDAILGWVSAHVDASGPMRTGSDPVADPLTHPLD